MAQTYNFEPRCDLSDLFKSQCSHCTMGLPTLGPMNGGVLDGEDA